MSNSNPTEASATVATVLSLHTSQAATEFDTNHAAWVDFDRHLSAEIARYEQQFEHYLTRQAVRKSLGR